MINSLFHQITFQAIQKKTKDKNIDHNGLRSKLKREIYLQKFFNNNPL